MTERMGEDGRKKEGRERLEEEREGKTVRKRR